MKSWRVCVLASFAWLSACIGGYDPTFDMQCALGIAIAFCGLMDAVETIWDGVE